MYKTHTIEEYNEVMELRNKGLRPIEIFSFLSKKGTKINYNTMYDWIHYNKKPFQEVQMNKIPKSSELLTKEKAYILGVLCGDGYISVNKTKGRYLLGLSVTDEDFANEFVRCVKSVYEQTPSKNKRIIKSTNYCKTPKPSYVLNLTSKWVVTDLLRYAKSFKTKEWIVPEEILKSNLEIKSAFLRGLFDSEGSISLKKPSGAYLSICSGNINSLLKVNEMLKEDFEINLKTLYSKRSVIKLKSGGYKNIKNFCDKVGFTIKRKQENLILSLSSYKRKGINKYSLEFKKRALKLLDEYQDVYFVASLLGINNANIYDWKKGKYINK